MKSYMISSFQLGLSYSQISHSSLLGHLIEVEVSSPGTTSTNYGRGHSLIEAPHSFIFEYCAQGAADVPVTAISADFDLHTRFYQFQRIEHGCTR